MRQAKVFFKRQEAGHLTQHDDGNFVFEYKDEWTGNPDRPPISPTLPKTRPKHYSNHLLPFFYNMLPEGTNKRLVCQQLRIDTNDAFGLLLATANNDTIGAVTLREIQQAE